MSRNLTVAKTITYMKTNTETKTKRLRFISIYSIYSGGMVCQSVTEAEDLYYTGATGRVDLLKKMADKIPPKKPLF